MLHFIKPDFRIRDKGYRRLGLSIWDQCSKKLGFLMPSLLKMFLIRYMFATDRCLPDLHQKIRCRGFPGEPREWSRRGNASWTSYDHCIDAK